MDLEKRAEITCSLMAAGRGGGVDQTCGRYEACIFVIVVGALALLSYP